MIIKTLTALLALIGSVASADVIIQSTTSTANSGLYDHLIPIFEEHAGIRVKVVAVGTGQAIRNASNCDGDVLLAHAKTDEEAFVEAGFGVVRSDLMYNDFIIVGPKADPAGIRNMTEVTAALGRIAEINALFASRGDDSGTHKKERALWRGAAHRPEDPSGTWYRETGSGMGATLNIAVGLGAYTLTDRATWLSFGNKGDYEIMVEGDPDLFNQYGVTLVNPAACPHAHSEDGSVFVNWLLSANGQDAIAAFKIDGKQLFFPNSLGHKND